jgi:general L-amino acid transport system permease protein
MSQQTQPHPHQTPPFWRNVRILSVIAQVGFLLVVALVGWIIFSNVTGSLERMGITSISYDFMNSTAGFEIRQTPIPYSPQDTYWDAFQVGVVNTLIVAVSGIVLATILGIVVGIAQLADNWLVSRIAQTYVAVFRNIPLLLQLLFWYFAVFQQLLPRVRDAIELPGPIFITNRGIAMIGPEFTETSGAWLLFILGGFIIAAVAWYGLKVRQDRTGQQSPQFLIGLAIVLASALLGWLLLSPAPAQLTVPELQRFNFQGGLQLDPEFAALLLGLTMYTGAFIAENVRAGIQGVTKGQKEAARALGLTPGQSMRLVILPQALRIIIPPTTSQYLNLTKNSSLAIAIAYAELFSVTRTIFNQTGQTLQIIALIMVSYLTISLTTSLLMNLYNRSVRLVEK